MMYDVIIIGSGPAGITAAIYAKRAGLSTLVVEMNYVSGGQVNNTYEVDNYPGLPGISGMELAERMKDHMMAEGAELARGAVIGISLDGDVKIVHTKKEDYRAKTVILASGAVHRKLEVPGEEELSGRGVSYCATCDGAFFRDKTVAVVGGGNVAVEDALFLARVCKKVYLIHRRDELRAAKVLQDAALAEPKIQMCWSKKVVQIGGTDRVEWIDVESVRTAELAAASTDQRREERLDVDGVFVAVGIQPDTAFVKDLVELDDRGYIKAGEDGKTSVPGIYAAGDIRTKALRQIITAAADGANCVASLEEYLRTIK